MAEIKVSAESEVADGGEVRFWPASHADRVPERGHLSAGRPGGGGHAPDMTVLPERPRRPWPAAGLGDTTRPFGMS